MNGNHNPIRPAAKVLNFNFSVIDMQTVAFEFIVLGGDNDSAKSKKFPLNIAHVF